MKRILKFLAKKIFGEKEKEIKKESVAKVNPQQFEKKNSERPKAKKPKAKPLSSEKTEKVEKVERFEKKESLELPEIFEADEQKDKVRFTDLPVHVKILAALQDLKFNYCTPIQALSLPASLANLDLAGKAQTGTGKTASFLIAAINKILDKKIIVHRRPGNVRVLVLAPTRELAIQIHKDCLQLCKYTDLHSVVVFGGMGHQAQQIQLRKPVDILVATPGRCLDFLQMNLLDLSSVEVLIIDEADRMLDMGFIPDVRKIVGKTPHSSHRQTLMFSATFTDTVLRLIKTWQRNPIFVQSEQDQVVTDLIEQRFYLVSASEKINYLKWILQNENVVRMIIFINRKNQAGFIVKNLQKIGLTAVEMSGDVPQNKRLKMVEDLRAGKIKVLVATDVAARGLHIDDISHVINYDLPVRAEDFIHRIGRTGRVGKTGLAYSFVCESGVYALAEIEKILGKEIKCEQPNFEKNGENNA